MTQFKAAHGSGRNWQSACDAALAALGPMDTRFTLGFVYINDPIGGDLAAVLERLRAASGIADWVGAVGFGVCGLTPAASEGPQGEAHGVELFERPSVALLVGDVPREDYRIFTVGDEFDGFVAEDRAWIEAERPQIIVVHANSHNPKVVELVSRLAEDSGAFLVGGMASIVSRRNQIAGRVVSGGASGVMFSSRVAVATGLSQGSAPLGEAHQITSARGNVLITLDGKRAIDVLMEDVGCDTEEQLHRLAGHVNAALLVPGSDTGDYVVRNLVGIDMQRGLVAIGDMIEPGGRLMFCGCGQDAAVRDLRRMVSQLAQRSGPPSGALYFSCVARGPNLFGPNAEEVKLLREGMGAVPMAGFYANGEISNNRLYGYTGVLAVFR